MELRWPTQIGYLVKMLYAGGGVSKTFSGFSGILTGKKSTSALSFLVLVLLYCSERGVLQVTVHNVTFCYFKIV